MVQKDLNIYYLVLYVKILLTSAFVWFNSWYALLVTFVSDRQSFKLEKQYNEDSPNENEDFWMIPGLPVKLH